VRRKGLTLKAVRRMAPGVYPRAIELVSSGAVDLRPLATHSYPLRQTAEAFDLQAGCREGVIKSVIEM
jgi:threonine dehydrogenase-like Zn-dependent dehydrogenase